MKPSVLEPAASCECRHKECSSRRPGTPQRVGWGVGAAGMVPRVVAVPKKPQTGSTFSSQRLLATSAGSCQKHISRTAGCIGGADVS